MIIQNFQATDVPATLSHASKEALVCAWRVGTLSWKLKIQTASNQLGGLNFRFHEVLNNYKKRTVRLDSSHFSLFRLFQQRRFLSKRYKRTISLVYHSLYNERI